ncbi:peptidoglycan-binding protein [Thermopetrobacter sp. TC1]|uniref:peptidoglycan-binding domain-containing protein n=1 Tax=Thermopetrobacter sp. TC1 TaxID=1495045 RepID=UPI00056E4DE2|nr:peptidoglycan-binding domain-containing protein [Thermopetrobacter sp. TC1]
MRPFFRWSSGIVIVLFSGAIAYNLFFVQSAIKQARNGAIVVEPDRLGELARHVAEAEKRRGHGLPARLVRTTVRPDGLNGRERDAAKAAVVLAAQRSLKKLGFYHGALDGRLGPATRRALLAFQKRLGLKATGIPDQTTLDRLRYEERLRALSGNTASIAPFAPTTEKRALATPAKTKTAAGDARITAVQFALARAGFDPGDIDGRLGPATIRALKRFQAAKGLAVTGRPDAATLKALGL